MKFASHLITTAALTGFVGVGALTGSTASTAQGQGQGQGTAPVRIVSPVPLPVRDVDNAARQPFQSELCTEVPLGGPL